MGHSKREVSEKKQASELVIISVALQYTFWLNIFTDLRLN